MYNWLVDHFSNIQKTFVMMIDILLGISALMFWFSIVFDTDGDGRRAKKYVVTSVFGFALLVVAIYVNQIVEKLL